MFRVWRRRFCVDTVPAWRLCSGDAGIDWDAADSLLRPSRAAQGGGTGAPAVALHTLWGRIHPLHRLRPGPAVLRSALPSPSPHGAASARRTPLPAKPDRSTPARRPPARLRRTSAPSPANDRRQPTQQRTPDLAERRSPAGCSAAPAGRQPLADALRLRAGLRGVWSPQRWLGTTQAAVLASAQPAGTVRPTMDSGERLLQPAHRRANSGASGPRSESVDPWGVTQRRGTATLNGAAALFAAPRRFLTAGDTLISSRNKHAQSSVTS